MRIHCFCERRRTTVFRFRILLNKRFMQESGRQDQALRPPVLRLRAVRRRSGITEATYGWGGGNIFGDIFKWFAAAWGDSRE